MNEVTRILESIQQGNTAGMQELIPLVYDELRTLASIKLARERPGQTLQATALVHEAYLRLMGSGGQWENRNHFFGAAAEAMRRILVDNARKKASRKHGGHLAKVDLESIDIAIHTRDEDLLRVDEALEKLSQENPVVADLVKLRFFVGMSQQEAAEALGLAQRTATRQWAYGRAWLYRELKLSLTSES